MHESVLYGQFVFFADNMFRRVTNCHLLFTDGNRWPLLHVGKEYTIFL